MRQIRVGSSKEARGTAYVVYEDIYDAKAALERLSGFNVQVLSLPDGPAQGVGLEAQGCIGQRTAAPRRPAPAARHRRSYAAADVASAPAPSPAQNRYLIVLYYNPARHSKKLSTKDEEERLRKMQEKYGVDGEQHPTAKA